MKFTTINLLLLAVSSLVHMGDAISTGHISALENSTGHTNLEGKSPIEITKPVNSEPTKGLGGDDNWCCRDPKCIFCPTGHIVEDKLSPIDSTGRITLEDIVEDKLSPIDTQELQETASSGPENPPYDDDFCCRDPNCSCYIENEKLEKMKNRPIESPVNRRHLRKARATKAKNT